MTTSMDKLIEMKCNDESWKDVLILYINGEAKELLSLDIPQPFVSENFLDKTERGPDTCGPIVINYNFEDNVCDYVICLVQKPGRMELAEESYQVLSEFLYPVPNEETCVSASGLKVKRLSGDFYCQLTESESVDPIKLVDRFQVHGMDLSHILRSNLVSMT